MYSYRNLMIIAVICCLLIWVIFWLPMALKAFLNGDNNDFHAYYIAGKAYLYGYNPYYDNSSKNEYLTEVETRGIYSRYIYPPTFVPAFSLLSQFQFKEASGLWTIINILLYMLTFLYLIRSTEKCRRPLIFTLCSVFTLLSYPLFEHIIKAQIDLMMIALIFLGFILYNQNQKFWSALLLAICTLIKVNPIFILIYYVVFFRDYRYLKLFMLNTIILIGLSLFLMPIEFYITYIISVLPDISGGYNVPINQSLIKFVAEKGFGPLPGLVSLGGFALFAVYANSLRRQYNHLQTLLDNNKEYFFKLSVFLMNCIMIRVFSPISWHNSYVWLILPAAVYLGYILEVTNSMQIILSTIISIFLITSRTMPDIIILDSLNLIGGVALLINIGYFLHKELPNVILMGNKEISHKTTV